MDLQFQTSSTADPFMMCMLGPGLPSLLPLLIAALPLAVVLFLRVRMAFSGLVTLLLMLQDFLSAI